MPFEKKQPGEQLQIRAEEWNYLMDAALALKSQRVPFQVDQNPYRRPTDTGKARNISGFDLPQFAAVALREPAIKPTDNLPEFQRQVLIDVAIAEASDLVAPKVGILLAPAVNGTITDVQLSGVAVCQVLVTDPAHEFADLVEGETYLQSADKGPVRILWKEGDGTTTGTSTSSTSTSTSTTSGGGGTPQWAIVHIGAGGGGGGSSSLVGQVLEEIPGLVDDEPGFGPVEIYTLNDDSLLEDTGRNVTAFNVRYKSIPCSSWVTLQLDRESGEYYVTYFDDNLYVKLTDSVLETPAGPATTMPCPTTSTSTSTSTTGGGTSSTTTPTITTPNCAIGLCVWLCDGTEWLPLEGCPPGCDCPNPNPDGCTPELIGATAGLQCQNPGGTSTSSTSTSTTGTGTTTTPAPRLVYSWEQVVPDGQGGWLELADPLSGDNAYEANGVDLNLDCPRYVVLHRYRDQDAYYFWAPYLDELALGCGSTTTSTTTTLCPGSCTYICNESNEWILDSSSCSASCECRESDLPETCTTDDTGTVPCVPTSTSTSTTTTLPCTGICTWSWNASSFSWSQSSGGCSTGCVCSPPHFCGPETGCATAQTYCHHGTATGQPCCGQGGSTTTTTFTTGEGCNPACEWSYSGSGLDPSSGFVKTKDCGPAGICGVCDPPEGGPALACEVVQTPCHAPPPIPPRACLGQCAWYWNTNSNDGTGGWVPTLGASGCQFTSYGIGGGPQDCEMPPDAGTCTCDPPSEPGSNCGDTAYTSCYNIPPSTTAPGGTTTTPPCVDPEPPPPPGPQNCVQGHCLYQWNGVSWALQSSDCPGCTCSPPVSPGMSNCDVQQVPCSNGTSTTITTTTTTCAGGCTWQCSECLGWQLVNCGCNHGNCTSCAPPETLTPPQLCSPDNAGTIANTSCAQAGESCCNGQCTYQCQETGWVVTNCACGGLDCGCPADPVPTECVQIGCGPGSLGQTVTGPCRGGNVCVTTPTTPTTSSTTTTTTTCSGNCLWIVLPDEQNQPVWNRISCQCSTGCGCSEPTDPPTFEAEPQATDCFGGLPSCPTSTSTTTGTTCAGVCSWACIDGNVVITSCACVGMDCDCYATVTPAECAGLPPGGSMSGTGFCGNAANPPAGSPYGCPPGGTTSTSITTPTTSPVTTPTTGTTLTTTTTGSGPCNPCGTDRASTLVCVGATNNLCPTCTIYNGLFSLDPATAIGACASAADSGLLNRCNGTPGLLWLVNYNSSLNRWEATPVGGGGVVYTSPASAWSCAGPNVMNLSGSTNVCNWPATITVTM